jgi:hypothetical protein
MKTFVILASIVIVSANSLFAQARQTSPDKPSVETGMRIQD